MRVSPGLRLLGPTLRRSLAGVPSRAVSTSGHPAEVSHPADAKERSVASHTTFQKHHHTEEEVWRSAASARLRRRLKTIQVQAVSVLLVDVPLFSTRADILTALKCVPFGKTASKHSSRFVEMANLRFSGRRILYRMTCNATHTSSTRGGAGPIASYSQSPVQCLRAVA